MCISDRVGVLCALLMGCTVPYNEFIFSSFDR